MVELQWVVGMRPGEVCAIRGCDIDMTGKQWIYTPVQHKNQYRGHRLEYYLDAAAQEIIKPFLKPDVTAYLFSPADAEADRRAKIHKQRVETKSTPLSCGNRPGTNVKAKPKKKPGACYTVGSYCHAIHKACEKAFGMPESMKPVTKDTDTQKKDTPEQAKAKAEQRKVWRAENTWHPHQLRHSRSTAIRRERHRGRPGGAGAKVHSGRRVVRGEERRLGPPDRDRRETVGVVSALG
jgi:integrase